MRILDKYIINRILSVYLTILVVVIWLRVIADLFTNLTDFLRSHTPLIIIFKYYLYFIPSTFIEMSSFAWILAIFMSLGELNRTNELISMRSSGISIIQLSTPIILLSIILSLTAFFFEEKVAIFSQKARDNIITNYVEKQNQNQEEIHNFGFQHKNQRIFIAHYSPQNKTIRGLEISVISPNNTIKEIIRCEKAVFQNNFWIGYNVYISKNDFEGHFQMTNYWETKKLPLDIMPTKLQKKKVYSGTNMSLKELSQEIKSRKNKNNLESAYMHRLILDYHRKFTQPFNHLFLTIGILPFALIIRKRKGNLFTLSAGVLFSSLYYFIYSISISLGYNNIIIPSLAAWLAPLFFLSMGITGLLLIH